MLVLHWKYSLKILFSQKCRPFTLDKREILKQKKKEQYYKNIEFTLKILAEYV